MNSPVPGWDRAIYRINVMQHIQKTSAKKSTIVILVLIALSFYVAIFAKYW